MKQFRTLALVSAVAAALGAQALVGSAQQAPAAVAPRPQVDVERLKTVRHNLASLLED